MSEESLLTCSSCGFRFNYRWTPAASMNAMRLGTARSFRCPRCHVRQAFGILDRGHDPAAPTYDDTLRAPLVGLALGPLLLAIPLSLALGLLAMPRLVVLLPVLAAVVWLAIFGALRLSRGEIPLGTTRMS